MTSPIFLEIENYSDVLNAMDHVKAEIITAMQLVQKIKALREQESDEIDRAKVFLGDMKHRLSDISEELLL